MKHRELFHRMECCPEPLPTQLNNLFDYTPREEVRGSAAAVVEALSHREDWVREEVARGKMFGVLVARDRDSGEVGYLAAFSGSIASRTTLEGFVPPIYDLDRGYFREQEAAISAINSSIVSLESDGEYRDVACRIEALERAAEVKIAAARALYREAKAIRRERREVASAEERTLIDRESQHQKGELRRLAAHLEQEVADVRELIAPIDTKIDALKQRRAELSLDLQRQLFESYRVVNGRGEWRSLLSIFDEHLHRLPPAGAGECAAPKLLHYALCNNLEPISIGEFWVGAPPRSEVRHEGRFYGACKGKCEPILGFMLQGLDVERGNSCGFEEVTAAEILYEDDHMVAYDKPSGMLSIVGNTGSLVSLESLAQRSYPWARVAHRLDQDTSGVILVAKSLDAYRGLQHQFATRTLHKRYIAVVTTHIESSSGEISLPLAADPMDSPRQRVDYEGGREALTRYEVLERSDDGRTRLALYPHTGRTHQLRVHCAHCEGLAAPIIGDRLYGNTEPSERLHLHHERIEFAHPITGEPMVITAQVTF